MGFLLGDARMNHFYLHIDMTSYLYIFIYTI